MLTLILQIMVSPSDAVVVLTVLGMQCSRQQYKSSLVLGPCVSNVPENSPSRSQTASPTSPMFWYENDREAHTTHHSCERTVAVRVASVATVEAEGCCPGCRVLLGAKSNANGFISVTCARRIITPDRFVKEPITAICTICTLVPCHHRGGYLL